MDFSVYSVGRYTHRQTLSHAMPHTVIALHISGLQYYRIGQWEMNVPGPYLSIIPANQPVAFIFNDQRENWAMVLEWKGLRISETPGMIDVQDPEGHWLTLPMITPLAREQVVSWEQEFMQWRQALLTPYPKSRLRLTAGIYHLLRFMIDAQADKPDDAPGPAQRLRRLIDQDESMKFSLTQLSRKCGYSADRLRVLFEREFGIAPQAYRHKKRLAAAAELLCNSDLRIKEISRRVGCRHVSHFSALCRTAFGLSPREYVRKFRQI